MDVVRGRRIVLRTNRSTTRILCLTTPLGTPTCHENATVNHSTMETCV